jgi:3-hydroxybutyryl-CoA dehydrogenase
LFQKPRALSNRSCCYTPFAREDAAVADIQAVAVIGAGTMGSGIAHVFAKSGFCVALCDVEQRFVGRALVSIRTNLGREAAKGKISESDIEAAMGRITPTTDMKSLTSAQLAIEAAPERFDLKSEIFRTLDQILPGTAILATNTSSISITKLAALTRRPGQVIGMHFFNPVPVMALVEVVRGMATSEGTFVAVRDLAVKLGKTPVEVNDAPGFVSNRVLMPLINEAAYSVMEGVATAEAVDQVFKLGMAHPMGPLTLADFIGIDVCVDILRVLDEGFGNPKYYPCPLLVRMVDAGWLGRKSGRGFYLYER